MVCVVFVWSLDAQIPNSKLPKLAGLSKWSLHTFSLTLPKHKVSCYQWRKMAGVQLRETSLRELPRHIPSRPLIQRRARVCVCARRGWCLFVCARVFNYQKIERIEILQSDYTLVRARFGNAPSVMSRMCECCGSAVGQRFLAILAFCFSTVVLSFFSGILLPQRPNSASMKSVKCTLWVYELSTQQEDWACWQNMNN